MHRQRRRQVREMRESFWYDMQRYREHSSMLSTDDPVQLQAKISAHFHVLEKGLSFHDTRTGFGMHVVRSLLSLLTRYRDLGYSTECSQFQSGVVVLREYVEYNRSRGYDVGDVAAAMNGLDAMDLAAGGVIEVSGRELIAKAGQDFGLLATSRSSIRHFSDKPVNLELIKQAVRIAQESPSSCNRQPTRVYVVTNKERICECLELEGGARGFGHMTDKLIIVAADQRVYNGPGERNMGWIDAAMFAMSLVYALHYLGLGACVLNWAVTKDKDLQLRELLRIDDTDNVLLFVVTGHLPEKLEVTNSQRRPLEDIWKLRT